MDCFDLWIGCFLCRSLFRIILKHIDVIWFLYLKNDVFAIKEMQPRVNQVILSICDLSYKARLKHWPYCPGGLNDLKQFISYSSIDYHN